MEDAVSQMMPYFLIVIAAAAASRIIADIVNWLWRKFGKPAMEDALLQEIRAEVRAIKHRIDLEFANGVPPDDDRYVPLRKANERDHERLFDNIETLFEMYGTQHDEITNIGRQVARQEAWAAKHEELTQRQATGNAS